MLHKMTPFLAFLALSVCNVNAQNAANNWHFGRNVRMNFNISGPGTSLVPTINTLEGSSSISDSTGALLFYTDGKTVWDKNDTPMTGGTGLLLGNPSSTHSALIVPCGCDRYFIFTTDAQENQYTNGLRYSVVDMTTGLGSVTSVNNSLLVGASGKGSEKVAGVSDGSGGFWVTGHTMGDNRFFSYHIVAGSACTLDPRAAVISPVGAIFSGGSGDYGQGQMKFSPDGTMLAVAGLNYQPGSFVELFQFNRSTGSVTNIGGGTTTARDFMTSTDGFYGVEFSPDSNALYATTTVANSNIYRYDNITVNQLTSRTKISNFGNAQYTVAALQLAPDGKIYAARRNIPSLYVLSNPILPNGGWSTTPFNLPDISHLGLPTVVAGSFSCNATPSPTPTPSATPRPSPTPTPSPTPGCGAIGRPRATCDHGIFTYTFTVTNNSPQTIQYLLLSPKVGSTFTITPNVINLGSSPLNTGQSTSVTVTIGNANPGDNVCINVTLADKNARPCCTIQTCVDLPECPCLRVLDTSLACGPPGTYTYTVTLQNLTGGPVHQIFIVPTPATVNVSPQLVTLSTPLQQNQTTTLTITITSTGAPGTNVCLRFSPLGKNAATCCSTERCFPLQCVPVDTTKPNAKAGKK